MLEVVDAEGVPCHIYRATAPVAPGLVWAHGGGFRGGSVHMPESQALGEAMANHGITFVSIDYRLAGDGAHYPVPSDDVLIAWRWVMKSRAALGLDAGTVCLGGGSAGGNLAAGAVLRMSPLETRPTLLVLGYPTLLAVQPPPSPDLRALLDAHPDADVCGADPLRRMYETFLGGPVDHAPIPATPAAADPADLADFPPTLFILDEIDELRESAHMFEKKLIEAGREVQVHIVRGSYHGHLNRPGNREFNESVELISRYINALTSHPGSRDLALTT